MKVQEKEGVIPAPGHASGGDRPVGAAERGATPGAPSLGGGGERCQAVGGWPRGCRQSHGVDEVLDAVAGLL